MLLDFERLVDVKVMLTNDSIDQLFHKVRTYKKLVVKFYGLISNLYPNFRSTIIAYGRKPQDWNPIDDKNAFKQLQKYYYHLTKYNLNGVNSTNIIMKLSEG